MTIRTIGPHVPQWTFGDRLRKVRREAARLTETGKLTQDQMAARLGVQVKAYSAWEADQNRPDDIVEIARRVEEEFHVPATWMLGLEDDPKRPTGGDSLTRLTQAKRGRSRSHARVVDATQPYHFTPERVAA